MTDWPTDLKTQDFSELSFQSAADKRKQSGHESVKYNKKKRES